MRTTEQVIDQYMEGWEACDIDKVMDVFDETSLLICGDKVYRGLKEIRDFFSYGMEEILPLDVEIEDIHQVIEDDMAYFVWRAKSEKCVVNPGMDTFLVKNGVISRQTAYLGIEG